MEIQPTQTIRERCLKDISEEYNCNAATNSNISCKRCEKDLVFGSLATFDVQIF